MTSFVIFVSFGETWLLCDVWLFWWYVNLLVISLIEGHYGYICWRTLLWNYLHLPLNIWLYHKRFQTYFISTTYLDDTYQGNLRHEQVMLNLALQKDEAHFNVVWFTNKYQKRQWCLTLSIRRLITLAFYHKSLNNWIIISCLWHCRFIGMWY